jgi:hypothetical protein
MTNPLKPSYCIRDGHCLDCNLAHECTDCVGKPLRHCGACGGLLGDNPETCRECWETCYPERCWECGAPHGAGYANRCSTCEQYLKD